MWFFFVCLLVSSPDTVQSKVCTVRSMKNSANVLVCVVAVVNYHNQKQLKGEFISDDLYRRLDVSNGSHGSRNSIRTMREQVRRRAWSTSPTRLHLLKIL